MLPMSERDREPLNASREPRRVRDDIHWRLWLVAIIGLWERAAFWGVTAPWQNYMEHPLHHDTRQPPGALGLGQAMSTRIYCAFYLFYYATPIIVAIVADRYLGRYTTLVVSVILYCLGCVALTVSSVSSNLEKGWGVPGLLVAMFLVGLGGGGFRAIFVTFIADQQIRTEPRPVMLKNGELVIIDYQITLQYIYNLYYWVGNIGSLSWFATVYLELHVGFTAAYGLTLGFMVVALIMLIFGKQCYVKISHEKNALPEAVKVLLCACRNGFNMAHTYPAYQRDQRHRTVSWSGQLVSELTKGLQACRVLLAFVVFYICFDQMQNNLISQAGQMDTGGTPNDLLPAMNSIGCIIFGPLIQEVLYPFLHRRRIYPTPITRITIGFAFVTLSMLYATIVQVLIYRSPPCYDRPSSCGSNQINVWVQAPLYFLISAGEIFAYVTALEYAYERSPKAMRVVVQAVGLLIGGVGSACAMALSPVARDPDLITFYGSLTGGMAITTVIFWSLFRGHDRQKMTGESKMSEYDAILSPAHCHPPDPLYGAAPSLAPIDRGDPIVLPDICLSFSSQGLHSPAQDTSKAPALPRRSSRRR